MSCWRSGMWPVFDCDPAPYWGCGWSSCSEGLSLGFLVFLPPQKTGNTPNSNSTWIKSPHENQLRLNTVIFLKVFRSFYDAISMSYQWRKNWSIGWFFWAAKIHPRLEIACGRPLRARQYWDCSRLPREVGDEREEKMRGDLVLPRFLEWSLLIVRPRTFFRFLNRAKP